MLLVRYHSHVIFAPSYPVDPFVENPPHWPSLTSRTPHPSAPSRDVPAPHTISPQENATMDAIDGNTLQQFVAVLEQCMSSDRDTRKEGM